MAVCSSPQSSGAQLKMMMVQQGPIEHELQDVDFQRSVQNGDALNASMECKILSPTNVMERETNSNTTVQRRIVKMAHPMEV